MSAALACGPSENTQGPAPARDQDNGAGCSPRGGETRAGTADFSAAATRRKAVRPAVKLEAESAPESHRRRGIHRGLGLRAREGTDRASLAAEPTAGRRELGTGGGMRASERRRGSPHQLPVSRSGGIHRCPGGGRQRGPSPHHGSASWNMGPAGRAPVSSSAGSRVPGARRAAGRRSGHRFTAEEWAWPWGGRGRRGRRPWQHRGAYDEGGAEQLKAGCDV